MYIKIIYAFSAQLKNKFCNVSDILHARNCSVLFSHNGMHTELIDLPPPSLLALQISTNGVVSFDSPYLDPPFLNDPLPIQSEAFLTPFWADVEDTNISCVRLNTSDPLVASVVEDIETVFAVEDFVPEFALNVLWEGATQQNSSSFVSCIFCSVRRVNSYQ